MATATPVPKTTGRSRGKPDLAAVRREIDARDASQPKAKAPTRLPTTTPAIPLTSVMEIPVKSIEPGRNPRTDTKKVDDDNLLASVKRYGVLMPIRVRPVLDGTPADGPKYQLIAGHRRLRAATRAKLATIPAMVATPTDSEAFVQALIENLQRVDLNAMDEANGYRAVLDEQPKLTQADLASMVGRSPSHVSNMLRILEVPDTIQQMVAEGLLTGSHVKAIAALDEDDQKSIAQQAAGGQMSAHQVEEFVGRRRQDAARARDEAKAQTERDARALKKVQSKKLDPKVVTIVASSNITRAPLEALGFKVIAENYQGHQRNPSFGCPCEKVVWYLDGWGDGLQPICIEPDHGKAASRLKATRARNRDLGINQANDKAKAKIARGLRTDDGLTPLGERVLLYVLIRQPAGNSSNSNIGDAFVKRYGGTEASVEVKDKGDRYGYGNARDFGPLWVTIQAMTDKDVRRELAERIGARAFSGNIFGNQSQEDWQDHSLRAHVGKELGIENFEWGHDKPAPKQYVYAGDRQEKEARIVVTAKDLEPAAKPAKSTKKSKGKEPIVTDNENTAADAEAQDEAPAADADQPKAENDAAENDAASEDDADAS